MQASGVDALARLARPAPQVTPAHLKMCEVPEAATSDTSALVSLIDCNTPDEILSYGSHMSADNAESGPSRPAAGADPALKDPFPILGVGSVYVLPGLPQLLRKKFGVLRPLLERRTASRPFLWVAARLSTWDETRIAGQLDVLAGEVGPRGVSVGSYPLTDQADGAGIELMLEGKEAAALKDAAERLVALLPLGLLISIKASPGVSL